MNIQELEQMLSDPNRGSINVQSNTIPEGIENRLIINNAIIAVVTITTSGIIWDHRHEMSDAELDLLLNRYYINLQTMGSVIISGN